MSINTKRSGDHRFTKDGNSILPGTKTRVRNFPTPATPIRDMFLFESYHKPCNHLVCSGFFPQTTSYIKRHDAIHHSGLLCRSAKLAVQRVLTAACQKRLAEREATQFRANGLSTWLLANKPTSGQKVDRSSYFRTYFYSVTNSACVRSCSHQER